MSELIYFITDNFGLLFGIIATVVWFILARLFLSPRQIKAIDKKIDELIERSEQPTDNRSKHTVNCEINKKGEISYQDEEE